MNLLIDQNISFRVIKKIELIFPNSIHVNQIKLENSHDISIWNYSKKNNYCIVTFDSDFIDISNLKGTPPKIIWLKLGNTSTENISKKLIEKENSIKEFLTNVESAFLEIE